MDKEKIRSWLVSIGKDRDWLAAECGTSKATVDGWFSTKDIPMRALIAIERLMKETSPASAGRFMTVFSTDEFEVIEQARDIVGRPLRQKFYHDAVMEHARSLIAQRTPTHSTEGGDEARKANLRDKLNRQAKKIGLQSR